MTQLLDHLKGVVHVPEAYVERCVDDDDDFDAFISALVARAVELNLTDPISRGDAWLAMREGWIHLPLNPATADRLRKRGLHGRSLLPHGEQARRPAQPMAAGLRRRSARWRKSSSTMTCTAPATGIAASAPRIPATSVPRTIAMSTASGESLTARP